MIKPVTEAEILRHFPRRNSYTPDDARVVCGEFPIFAEQLLEGVSEIRVSATFRDDRDWARNAVKDWKHVSDKPVFSGGPAFSDPGGEFTPGLYLKRGYTITSRGCPNKCWFCSVWKTEGRVIRELEIKPGHTIQDNNLLACSRDHIEAVFAMLKTQRAASFPGGIEAARLEPWHLDLFASIKVHAVWLADDEPGEHATVLRAVAMLKEVGLSPNQIRCYVLSNFPGDSTNAAEARCLDLLRAGCNPFMMLWKKEPAWRDVQRTWTRPACYVGMLNG